MLIIVTGFLAVHQQIAYSYFDKAYDKVSTDLCYSPSGLSWVCSYQITCLWGCTFVHWKV